MVAEPSLVVTVTAPSGPVTGVTLSTPSGIDFSKVPLPADIVITLGYSSAAYALTAIVPIIRHNVISRTAAFLILIIMSHRPFSLFCGLSTQG